MLAPPVQRRAAPHHLHALLEVWISLGNLHSGLNAAIPKTPQFIERLIFRKSHPFPDDDAVLFVGLNTGGYPWDSADASGTDPTGYHLDIRHGVNQTKGRVPEVCLHTVKGLTLDLNLFQSFHPQSILQGQLIGNRIHHIETHHPGSHKICGNHVSTGDENAQRTRNTGMGAPAFTRENPINQIEIRTDDLSDIDQCIGEIDSPVEPFSIPERDKSKKVLDTQRDQRHGRGFHLGHIHQKIHLIENGGQGKGSKDSTVRNLLSISLPFVKEDQLSSLAFHNRLNTAFLIAEPGA